MITRQTLGGVLLVQYLYSVQCFEKHSSTAAQRDTAFSLVANLRECACLHGSLAPWLQLLGWKRHAQLQYGTERIAWLAGDTSLCMFDYAGVGDQSINGLEWGGS
jgi:hypothetical protein